MGESDEAWYTYKAKQYLDEIELEDLKFLPEAIRNVIIEKIGAHCMKRGYWLGRQHEKSYIGRGAESPRTIPVDDEAPQVISQSPRVA